jgi:hypothetical protein
MTKTEEDTDPSTPKSKRASDPSVPVARAVPRASVDAGAIPSDDDAPQAQDATDPGLGPAGSRAPLSKRGASVVVPPPYAGAVVRQPVRGNDSVDLLLDGIAEQPDRRARTTPQTAGQSAATYHAQHGLRAARTNADTEPLVVVEAQAVPEEVSRAVRQRDAADGSSAQGSSGPISAIEPTPAVEIEAPRSPEGPGPRSLEVTPVFAEPAWPRVAVAVGAGVAVVTALFLLFRSTAGVPPAPGGVASRAIPAPPQPAASALPSGRVPFGLAAPVQTATTTPSGPPATDSAEAPAEPAPARSARPRGAGRSKPVPSSSARPPDLGEFKLTY